MPPLKLFNAIVLGGSMLVAGACGGSQSNTETGNASSQPTQTQTQPAEGQGEQQGDQATPAEEQHEGEEGGGVCTWNFLPRPH